jgi:hypothetical protein
VRAAANPDTSSKAVGRKTEDCSANVTMNRRHLGLALVNRVIAVLDTVQSAHAAPMD